MVKHLGKEFTIKTIQKAKPIYKSMLSEVTDIGSNNPMAANIYMGFVFMALYQVAAEKCDYDTFYKIVEEMMRRPILKKVMGGSDLNTKEGEEKLRVSLHRCADWLNDYPQYRAESWDFNFDDSKHQDGIYYHFTRCPMEKYAREHGLLEILTICCDIDYLTAEAQHAVLHRKQTLATGGEMCDYWMVGNKKKD